MVRSFEVAFSTELEKEASHLRHLILVSASAASTYCWTDCDQDIYFNGQKYDRKNFTFDSASYGIDSKVDSVVIEFENIDKAFSDLILGTDIQGRQIDILRVALNANLDVLGATGTSDAPVMFRGYTDMMEIDRRKARVHAYNHFIKWKTITPRRQHSPNCQWVFKSTQCNKTSTEVECDKTWDKCTEFTNTTNFGGFRHLPDLETKELMWGKIQKQWSKK